MLSNENSRSLYPLLVKPEAMTMNTANEDNGLFKIAIWSKDKQTLSVVMTKSPTDPSDEELLLSLSTQ
jgi:hypothetical protein